MSNHSFQINGCETRSTRTSGCRDDEDTVEENAELRGLMPFAIVGSEDVVEV